MLPCSVNSVRNMAPLPDSTLDPDRSFSPSREVMNCPRTLNLHYNSYYPMPSPPFSPPNFIYDSLFTPDTLPVQLPSPDPDPEALEELATIPAVAAPATTPRRKATGCRRRRFRTDRHSKIHTSQGLRDRRMRLSLGVARHFFRLQDVLGFDKASHTIDWLLKQSKSAIDLLARSSASFDKQALNDGSFVVAETSASECEVVSSDSHHTNMKTTKAKGAPRPAPRKTVGIDGRFRRESRAKARARARERTIEKKRIKGEESNSLGLDVLDGLMNSEVSNEVNECSDMSMVSSWLMYCNEETGTKET